MLTLITFKPFLGTRSASPFTTKVEALLRMAELPYEKEFGDVRKAPRAKFPVLRDGDKVIPDSSHIQAYLVNEKGADFDSHLSPKQKAIQTAFRRLIEHHLYFLNGYFRWFDHPETVRDNYFADVPGFMRSFVFKMVKKDVGKGMYMQGLGRHTREEMIAFIEEDIDAIATQLGNNPYFLGNKISSIDASLWSMLHNLIDCPLDVPGRDHALTKENLVSYTKRLAEELFDD